MDPQEVHQSDRKCAEFIIIIIIVCNQLALISCLDTESIYMSLNSVLLFWSLLSF